MPIPSSLSRRRCWFVGLLGCWGVVSAVCPPEVTAAPPAAAERVAHRRYGEGPLTAADFRAPVPDPPPAAGNEGQALAAYTFTEVRYELKFESTGRANRWTARLTQAEAFAVVDRNRSWNRYPDNERLLDHEQGHFDLTQIAALAMQRHLHDRLYDRPAPAGTGATSAEAIQDLHDRLRKELEPFLSDHLEAQKEYDRLTQSGILRQEQAEQRSLHRAELQRRQEGLQAARKAGRP